MRNPEVFTTIVAVSIYRVRTTRNSNHNGILLCAQGYTNPPIIKKEGYSPVGYYFIWN